MDKKKLIIIISALVIILAIVAGIIVFNIVGVKSGAYKIEEITEYNYFSMISNSKVGVIDKEGNIIVEAIYDDIQIPNPTKPVFICVYGYDQTTGEYSIKALNEKQEQIFTEYDEINYVSLNSVDSKIPFEKSVLKVKKGEKYGLINFEGKVIAKPIYDEIKGLTAKEGEFAVKKDDKYGVINMNGKKVIDIKYDYIDGDEYTEIKESGYIIGIKDEESNVKYGYINSQTKILVKPEYDGIKRIHDVKDKNDIYLIFLKDGDYGVIKNKEVYIEAIYGNLEYYPLGNIFRVVKDGKTGVIKFDKSELVPIEFDDIYLRGTYIVTIKDNEQAIVSIDGNTETNDAYIGMTKTENGNYIVMDKNKNYGVADKDLNIKIPLEYSYIEYIRDDVFIVSKDSEHYGALDIDNKEIIPIKYDAMRIINDTDIIQVMDTVDASLIMYSKSFELMESTVEANLYIYADYIAVHTPTEKRYYDLEGNKKTGQEIYPNNTLYIAYNGEKWGFVNKEGEVVIDYIYDDVTEFNQYGFAGICKDGKWGSIKSDNTIVIEPTYIITDAYNEPDFIGKYYRLVYDVGIVYYTDMQEELTEGTEELDSLDGIEGL